MQGKAEKGMGAPSTGWHDKMVELVERMMTADSLRLTADRRQEE
jgi:hypothetical protein